MGSGPSICMDHNRIAKECHLYFGAYESTLIALMADVVVMEGMLLWLTNFNVWWLLR